MQFENAKPIFSLTVRCQHHGVLPALINFLSFHLCWPPQLCGLIANVWVFVQLSLQHSFLIVLLLVGQVKSTTVAVVGQSWSLWPNIKWRQSYKIKNSWNIMTFQKTWHNANLSTICQWSGTTTFVFFWEFSSSSYSVPFSLLRSSWWDPQKCLCIKMKWVKMCLN